MAFRCRYAPASPPPSAAAASACISLSQRGVARRIQFVTAHARGAEPLDIDWTALADRSATTAFYMGRAAAPEISRQLIAHGLPPTTPVLIACDVSLPTERLLHTRLDLLPLAAKAIADTMPALILIGEATRARPTTLARADQATALP